jgi:uncharacterized membrane protein YesL
MIWQKKDGDFFAVVERVATFLLANFVWFVLSITIIGIPFATVGLFAVMTKWVQGKQPEFFSVFFEAIREHWQKALIIVMADVAVGVLLFTNLTILPMMNAGDVLTILSRSITIFAGLTLFMANLYIWPLVTMIDLGINPLNKMVFMLIFTHPLKSAALLMLTLLPIGLAFILPRAFVLFALVSATAYIASYGTWFMLRKQFSPEELQNLQFKTIALQNKDIS